MRVSVSENFRMVNRLFYFSRIKNFTAGEDSATGQCERTFNKLARTFAAQVETLKR